jgi:uncharacterized protein (TIGR03067 family)
MQWHKGIVLVLSLLPAANLQKTTPEMEGKKLQGNWQVITLETNGKEVSPDDTDRLKVMITGNTMIFKGSTKNEEMTFMLDPSKKPKEIDLLNPDKTVGTFLGIYALEGGELKICYGRKEKDRPGEFGTKSGDHRVYLLLRREKK